MKRKPKSKPANDRVKSVSLIQNRRDGSNERARKVGALGEPARFRVIGAGARVGIRHFSS